MRKSLTLLAASFAALIAAAPAQAEWMRADSPHFTVYADLSERDIRKQTDDLELFDAAVRLFLHTPDTPEARHNKVTLFVLPSLDALQRLARSETVAGFYNPRVDAVAFTFKGREDTTGFGLSPRIVLFHEYTHHLLLSSYTMAIPAWFSEGFAEFASTAAIGDAGVTLGGAANHRAESLQSGRLLTAAAMFSPPARMTNDEVIYMYARGWLLTQLVLFDPARKPQFNRYLGLLNGGTPSGAAASQAFGDLRQLDHDLDTAQASRLHGFGLKRDRLPAAAVAIRPLTGGEKALIDDRIQSTRGVDARTGAALFARARAAAAPFPRDAVAQGWLAEMAYDAGDDAAAEAAADAALAVDPTSGQALVYKARVHLRRAGKGTAPGRWTEARSWLLKANAADRNNAAALLLYYESFAMAREAPSPGAVNGLYRVVELAPQDKSARLLAARQLLIENDVAAARAVLRPLAFAPHTGANNPAARLLAALDGGATGPAALRAADDAAKVDGATGG